MEKLDKIHYFYNQKKERYDLIDSFSKKIKSIKKEKKAILYRPGTSDSAVISQVFKMRDYNIQDFARCQDIYSKYNNILRSGKKPLIIDCGANIGVSALYWRLVFKDAKIIAVEPDPENASILKLNTKNSDIKIIEGAISSTSGTTNLINPGAGAWGYRVSDNQEGIKVNKYTIPDIVKSSASDTEPFIIKIDIEGGEGDLFTHNNSWFDDFYLAIIELHDWMLPKAKTSSSFLKMVSQLDRDFVYRNENIFSIKND